MASESTEKSHESSVGAERKTSDAKVEEWRRKLTDHYLKEMQYYQINPDNEGNQPEEEKPLLVDIYVQPRMEIVPAQSPSDSHNEFSPEKKYIYSYSGLFAKEKYKRAFISSCTGMGKTTFAKKMVLTWCRAWRGGEVKGCKFEEDDVNFMQQFELLFYVVWNSTQDSESNVTDKLFYLDQPEDNAARTEKKEILNKYKCLLILDDVDRLVLDQYSSFKTFTILATSRSDIPAEEDEMHVTLSSLTRTASQELQKNVIQQFKGKESSSRQIQEDMDTFDDAIAKSNIGEFASVPSILLQELWLWKLQKPSKNKFEAQKYRFEQVLLRAHKKGMFNIIRPDPEVPDYIKGAKHFGVFHDHVLKLGEIAFEMLCKQFTGSKDIVLTEQMRNYQSSSEAGFFVRTGILTLATQEVVFSERTVQEFFAAIYVAGQWKNLPKKKSMVQKFLGLPNVLKMNSVLNFVKDMDVKLYEDIYDTFINRADLEMYLDLEGYNREGMNVRVYGGRFLHFEEGEMGMIVRDCNDEIAKGRFGPVYKCSKLEEKYGNLTVKKIELVADKKKDIMECINQEWLASRYLHPFLLSTMTILRTVSEQRQTFYLLSPFCELGNLFEVLHGKAKLTLKWWYRVRIIFQVALGIDYLHNASRRPMVHRNVCSANIVLDRGKNARLIDYSDSRPDDTTGHSPEESKREDCRKFGVVMAELLTDKEPAVLEREGYTIQCPKKFLGVEDTFKKISELADKCLKAESSFSLQSGVIGTLKNIYYKSHLTLMQHLNERCTLCMVNVGISRRHHSVNCSERMKICNTCENSLYSDPLKCFRCGFEQQVESGKHRMALLVAGNDERKNVALAFGKDVEEMKRLLTAPEIFGISQNNIRLVKPEVPGEEDKMLEKFETAINELAAVSHDFDDNKRRIHNQQDQQKEKDDETLRKEHTLVFYYSGHREAGFRLGIEQDNLELCEVEKNINLLNVQKAVMFIDCCCPPRFELKEGLKHFQISACRSDQLSEAIYHGSLFTRYLIEAVIETAIKYPKPGDSVISVFSLLKHCTQITEKDGSINKPAFYSPWYGEYKDFRIGHRFLEPLQVTFHTEDQKETIPVNRSMIELENDIFLAFAKDQNEYSVQINVESDNSICKKIGDVIKASVLQEKLIVKFKKLPVFQRIDTVEILD